SKMLTMWVTEDEHRRLLERCDGKQLAAWMRQTCLDEKPARAGKLPSISPARAGFSSRHVWRIQAASCLPSQRSSRRRCSSSVTHIVSILL
ncbi:hypothetical protein NXY81_24240, partial [Escherichia coli]|nr:hypothetical protein [Escherichia coli]